jgi:uncharacterized LabA/DUF88 family protein
MLDDAYQQECDVQVLVSGDSDLVPAIHAVKRRFPSMITVAYIPARNPKRGAAVEIRGAADRDKTLPLALLRKCHLPAVIDDGSGNVICKPSEW